MNPDNPTTEGESDFEIAQGMIKPPTTTGGIIERLQYIADSPTREHGGFHPEAIQTAKDAIAALAAERERANHNADIGDSIARASRQVEQQLREQLAAERVKFAALACTQFDLERLAMDKQEEIKQLREQLAAAVELLEKDARR